MTYPKILIMYLLYVFGYSAFALVPKVARLYLMEVFGGLYMSFPSFAT